MKLFQSIVMLCMMGGCLLLAILPPAKISVQAANNANSQTINNLSTPVLLATSEATEKVEAPLHRDVNGDGIVDSLFIIQNGGSVYGGSYLTIIDGRTQKTYSADNSDYYGAGISVCTININEPAFARTAEELLLPKEVRQVVDPVGSWLIRANSKKRILSNNPHFDMVTKPIITWVDSREIPSVDYCVKVPVANGRRYLKNRARHPDEMFAIEAVLISRSAASVWFVWRGYRFNKEPLKEVFRGEGSVIYANNNCVGIEREDGRFAWLFVNDACLFGRTDDGIESLEVKERLMLLELTAPKRVIVDITTGKLASCKPYSDNLDEQGNIKPSIHTAFKTL